MCAYDYEGAFCKPKARSTTTTIAVTKAAPPPPAASTTMCAGCLDGTAGECKQSGGSNICVAIAAGNICPPTFASCSATPPPPHIFNDDNDYYDYYMCTGCRAGSGDCKSESGSCLAFEAPNTCPMGFASCTATKKSGRWKQASGGTIAACVVVIILFLIFAYYNPDVACICMICCIWNN
jgi:hypothetical protein